MTCAVCGAAADRARTHCLLCGHAHDPNAAKRWDRGPEAAAWEDLEHTLEPNEQLLAATRGRVAGAFRRRLALHPQVAFSPYVNVGITPDRLIVQQVHPGTGRALSDKGSGIPLSDVRGITITDADPIEPGRMARIVVQMNTGETFRLRSAGRLAAGARQLVEVWQALTGGQPAPTVLLCPHCARSFDRPYRFCPFCGSEQPTPNDAGGGQEGAE